MAEIDPGILDSKRLQMFYLSVREGSFAGAAQILSISPSAISHAMKSLEEELGCPLFRRLGPQVKPTAAAVRLLPMVEDLLVRMSSMKNELAALGGRIEHLAFRVPSTLLGIFPPGLLSTFHECFPAADFEIMVRGHEGVEGARKRVDFEVDYLEDVPPEMVRRDLVEEAFHAYVAPFHPLGQKSRLSAQDLRRNLLVFHDFRVFSAVLQQLGGGGEAEPRKWIVPDPQVAMDLAKHGQGIVFLPEWAAAESAREGALTRIKLPGLRLRRTCCAWWEPKRPLTWAAEVFLGLFAETKGRDPVLG